MLTLLTPTGARPDAFSMCAEQMRRQTFSGPVRWIIVDDGPTPVDFKFSRDGWSVERIRPAPLWSPGQNTQGRNLTAGLMAARSDPALRLAVIEDDDWYDPRWLETVDAALNKAALIGETFARYYNVRTRRWQRLGNVLHASLRCTAMRGDALDVFEDVLKTPHDYYDLKLWVRDGDKLLLNTELTVGIKGMPGRAGIAPGHVGDRGAHDPNGDKLRALVGDDAEFYLRYYKDTKPMAKSRKKSYIVTRPFRYMRTNFATGDLFTPEDALSIELHLHAKKIKLADDAGAPVKKRAEKKPDPQPDLQQELTPPPAEEAVDAAPAGADVDDENSGADDGTGDDSAAGKSAESGSSGRKGRRNGPAA